MDSEALEITRIEFLSVLSRGLDLAEGRPNGHAIRVATVAALVARHLGLSYRERYDVFVAGLLHDAGLTTVSSEINVALSGSEMTDIDIASFHADLLAGQVADAALSEERISALRLILSRHAEAGARIAVAFELGPEVESAIRYHHVSPSGEAVPLSARILAAAEGIEQETARRPLSPDDVAALFSAARRRFDSRVAEAAYSACAKDIDLAALLARPDTSEPPLSMFQRSRGEPWMGPIAAAEIAAQIIDHKSPYTRGHSKGVASLVAQMGQYIGLRPQRLAELTLAAWLHDIGKLSVPNRILEKRERLTKADWDVIHQHPRLTETILASCPRLRDVAHFAGRHHERVDGRGYPYGIPEHRLNPECRILAVADVFSALCENRPHRRGVETERAMHVLRAMSRGAVDPALVEVLASIETEDGATQPAADDDRTGEPRQNSIPGLASTPLA